MTDNQDQNRKTLEDAGFKVGSFEMRIGFINDKGGELSQEDKDKFEAALTEALGDTDILTDVDVVISY